MHLGRLTRLIENAWHLDDAGGDGGLADAAANRLIKVGVGVVAAKATRQIVNRFASLQGSIRTLKPLFSSSTMPSENRC